MNKHSENYQLLHRGGKRGGGGGGGVEKRSCGLIIKAIGIDNVSVHSLCALAKFIARYTMIKNAIKFEFSGEERFFIEIKAT